MEATSLWHISTTSSKLEPEQLTNPTTSQMVVKSLYSLISTGTERLVASGLVPPAMHQLMRVPNMGGGFSFPVKYGYSLVGKVISKGKLKGQLVH